MRPVSIISELTGVTSNVEASEVTLTSPSVVKLQLERSDIASITRTGQDMVIKLHSGETITLKNFYVQTSQGANQLVLEDAHGALWWVQEPNGVLHFQQIDNLDAFMIGEGHSEGGAIWPWVLGGVAVAAGVGIAAAGGGGGGGGGSDNKNSGGDGNGNGNGNNGGGNNGNGNNGNGNNGGGNTDTTPPGAPTNLAVSADGTTVTGKAEAGSTVEVKDADGNVLGKGTADSSGNFSITLSTPELSGEHLSVNATDKAGNTGPSASVTAPNVALPETPVITSAVDDHGGTSTTLTNNQYTNDNTPILKGTGTAGSTVHIFENGHQIGTTVVGSDGTWSYTVSTVLADGTYAFTAIAFNIKGHSIESSHFNLTIDTTAPAAPVLQAVTDDVGSIVGPLHNGSVTDDAKPTFTGTGEAGDTVTFYDGQTVIGTTKVDANGNWSFTPSQPLSQAAHTITITQTDLAGNVSATTTAPTFTVDTTPPAPAHITDVSFDGTTVGGTAEAGSTVSIFDSNNTLLGSAIVDANGNFTITLNPAQTHGQDLEARIQDAAGNVGQPTDFEASDSGYPTQPVIVSVADDVAPVTGNVSNGGYTNDNTPTLTGTAEPGTTIVVSDNGTPLLPIVIADVNGNWSFTPVPPLIDGDHIFTATANNGIGTSGPSTSFTVDVDTQIPTLTNLAVVDQGLTLTGHTEAGSTVIVKDSFGTQLGTGTADQSGNFSITLNSAQNNGQSLTVSVTDRAANIGVPETITAPDTTPPAAPTGLMVGADGLSVSGHAEPYSVVTITDGNGNVLGTATTNSSGNFVAPLNTPELNGQALYAVAEDAAHNKSLPSSVVAPDITPPDAPNGLVVNANGTQLTGNAEAGSTVVVKDPDGDTIGTVKADPSGHFTVTLSPAQDNGETLSVTATDMAGNTSLPGLAHAPDITAPDAPVILQVLDDVPGIIGAVLNGQTTNDSQPTLSGTAEAGSTVKVYENGNLLGSASVDVNGNWNFTPGSALSEGSHQFTVTATDSAGNVSQPSAGWNIVVDTLAPQIPAITLVYDDMPGIIGPIANAGLTNDSTPTVSGIAQPGSVVHLYDNGTLVTDITVGGSGAWSYTFGTALTGTAHSLTVTASDAYGNTSNSSAAWTFTLDTTPPSTPVITDVITETNVVLTPNQLTNETLPKLEGTGDVGSVITVYDNGNAIGQATVNGSGHWDFTPALPLGDGTHNLTVTATDAAGNTSGSTGFTLRVDDTPPNAPQIISATVEVDGSDVMLANGSTTNQTEPVISGTSEANATVTLYDNGIFLATVTANGQGQWSYPTTAMLDEGLHVLTATAKDAAGNVSPTSSGFSIDIDVTAPLDLSAPVVTDNVQPVIGIVPNNGTTNDTTPTFSGTGEVGSTITLYNGATEIGTTTVNESGNWSFTPSSGLPQATYVISTTETDIAGNVSAHSPTVSFTIDTVAPTPPVILSAFDDVGILVGPIGSGTVTDDNTPMLSGTAEAFSTVTVSYGNVVLGTATADILGNWSLPLTHSLPDGNYTFTATATDSAGNVSGQSNSFSLTIDTTVLQPPVVQHILDNVGIIQGELTSGMFTDDQTLDISGTAQNNTTVIIYDNGLQIGTANVTNGQWSFTTPTLSETTHSFTFTERDASNQESAPTAPVIITVDLHAPADPTITIISPDGTTIAGLAEANSTVIIKDASGNVLGTVQATAGGFFVATISPAQTHGETLTAIDQDQAGNQSPGLQFTASNTQLPDVPAITLVNDDVGTVTGPVASGGSTDDTTPTISGTADLNTNVHVLIDGFEVAIIPVDALGNWSYTPGTGLLEGPHNITVFASNAVGNSGVSAPYAITVDLTPPPAPTIVDAINDVQPHPGTLIDGALTNDPRPTLTGLSEPNDTITIFDNGTKIGTTVADSSGNWSFTPSSDISSANHTFTAQATDPAGNTGPMSGNFSLVVDTTAPVTPAISSVTNDNVLPVVVVNSGQATNDTTPLLSGTAESGSTVNVYDNGTLIGTVLSVGGTWTLPIVVALPEGTHNLTVTATDPAGNTSAPSTTYQVTVDTTPPATPILNSVVDDQPAGTGQLVNGQLTNDSQPTLNGHAEAGATVTIRVDGVAVGTALANGSGVWSWTPTTPLSDGNHTFTLYATDPAGNSSGLSGGFTVNVDATPPAAPLILSVADNTAPVIGVVANGGSTNETHPTISGTGEAGATITLYNGSTQIGTAVVNTLGNWSFTPTTALTAGSWNITATATDLAGNTGPASAVRSFIVDTTAPDAPAITTVFDDQGTVTGNLTSGSVTDDARPAISGTSEANAVIKIYDNGSLLATVTANGSGAWNYTPTVDMTQGSHILTATATDAAGNVSAASGSFTFVLDSLAPQIPVITSLTDDVAPVIGQVISGGSTNDKTPTLSGTAEAGATVKIYDGAALVGTATANASGVWSVTTSTLADGPHSLTATATDLAGNVSSASLPFAVTIDTAAPVLPVLTSVVDDVTGGVVGALTSGQLTNDNQPTLNGTAEAGSTISVYDGSTLLGTTVATGGVWSFTPPTALPDGSHTLTVTATDAAGNISNATAGFIVVVDATLPVTPVITTIIDDVPNNIGAIANGQFTNDSQPTLNGTAEANSTVKIYDNGTLATTVTANAAGVWTWTPSAALPQGNHSFTVTSTDTAGNLSATSTAAAIIVDTVAPGAVTGLAVNGTGTRVTGSAEANSTVTITSSTGTVLGTATADGTGAFTVTLSPAQTTGQSLLAFAQDRAGNVGVSTSFTAPDTRVPDAPAITSVVDDVPGGAVGVLSNGQLTNDAKPTLNGTAQANATISIYNNGALLGTTTANASGIWAFTPSGNVTEGAHAFTATATNANGTGSPSAPVSIVVDTTAPSVPVINISADGSTLTGTAEANSTVTITLPGGAGTLTTTAGSNGSWSITLPVREIEGQVISATATDAAGNISGPGSVTAPILPLSASDNVTSLALTSTATTSTQHFTDYGLLLVGALGNVASVLGNNTAQVQFTIANGGTGDVTIDAAATGIVLSLLSTQQIVVQKYDTASGSWTSFIDTGTGNFATLLTLTGSGMVLNLIGLTGGQYRVLTYNTSLLATGSYTNLEVDVHQTSAGTLSGPTTESGNVILDIDPTHGEDNAPTGTLVTQITDANGVTIPVGTGGVDVQGLYGTLHINPNGTYTYTLTSTSAGVIGHSESFTYTIADNGVSDSAKLIVTLGPVPAASTVVTADDSASMVFNTAVSDINNGASSQSGFTLVGVGLGNVLSLNVLANLTNPVQFDVQDGSTRTVTLQSSVGGVALASTFDLYIYRFNDATQQYEQYQVQKGWLNAPLLGGQSSQLTLTLPSGEYLFLLNTASGLTVATGYTLNILQDHTYAVDSLTATTSGNVLTNDVIPTGAHLTEVNGVAVASSGTTTINGHYGTLVIDANGNYTYTLKSGIGADGISTPDSFVYTVTAANGDMDSASLNITPTPQALHAVNDISSLMAVSTTEATTAYTDTTLGKANWSNPLIGSASGSGSGTFTVDANAILHNAVLHFAIASGLSLTGLSGTWSISQGGTVVQHGTFSGSNVDINLSDLAAGDYTLNYTGNSSGIGILGSYTVTPSISGTENHLDTFNVTSGNVTGNIFDGTDAAGAADQLSTVHTLLTVNGFGGTATLDPTGSASSVTVQGHYGTLTMNLDGSYSYTLTPGVNVASINSQESFTYTLNDQNGHTSTATLAINMNPQMVSTGQHDIITGSTYGDTLIFNLLSGSDATGGNGNDEWTNFNLAQGDKIDISKLLTGWDHQASTLGNFVQVTTSGANTVISIDRDGTGSTYHSTTLVTLDNVHTTLNELLQNNHIITG